MAEKKKQDAVAGAVIGGIIAIALLIALLSWYIRNFSGTYAFVGCLLGTPFGAGIAAGIGALVARKRISLDVGPLPLMQHALGIEALNRQFLPPRLPPLPEQAAKDGSEAGKSGGGSA